MSLPLNIMLAQINPTLGDIEGNLNKIEKTWVMSADDTDIIVFPEMVLCGYPPEDLVQKPAFLDALEHAVTELVEQSKDLKPGILVSCPWRIDGKIYNAAHLIEGGKLHATVTKHRLPNYGVFDEQRHFTTGPLPDAISYRGHKVGIMICEDMWHEDVAAHLKSQSAEVLITINASPYHADKTDIRLEHAKARVSETCLPLIYVNQIGGQDELVFDGGSFVMQADGSVETALPLFKTALVKATSPMERDTLPREEEIYQALTLGLRDYIQKNNFPGVLLGLSGGIDSALSAVIAVDALGADKVHCVMMPSAFTSQDSLDDAQELADSLGVKLDNISIEKPANAFNEILKPHFGEGAPDTTFENIQPRSRGLILMALSNASGKMVLSTGNKSEMAVGYATLYGDMCGGYNVLKDVYKTDVYAISRWRNSVGDTPIMPERIITKAPTAELKDNQTDQDTLPPYDQLDDILTCLIENEMSTEDIAARGHDKDLIAKVWGMLDRTEYKRRQAPPGVKITSRSFGRDRRYPITNKFKG